MTTDKELEPSMAGLILEERGLFSERGFEVEGVEMIGWSSDIFNIHRPFNDFPTID